MLDSIIKNETAKELPSRLRLEVNDGIDYNSAHTKWKFSKTFKKALIKNSDKGPAILHEGGRILGKLYLYNFIKGKSPSEVKEVLNDLKHKCTSGIEGSFPQWLPKTTWGQMEWTALSLYVQDLFFQKFGKQVADDTTLSQKDAPFMWRIPWVYETMRSYYDYSKSENPYGVEGPSRAEKQMEKSTKKATKFLSKANNPADYMNRSIDLAQELNEQLQKVYGPSRDLAKNSARIILEEAFYNSLDKISTDKKP